MIQLAKAVATVFGTGYSPFAPGTVGTLFGCMVVYLISLFVDINWTLLLVLSVLTYSVGFWSIYKVANIWPHDDNRIVIDEVVGIFVSILFIPYSLKMLVCAFFIFRFFDIIKPMGIRYVDKLQTHNGVLLDDVLAGVYTNIILQIILRWDIVSL